VTDVLLCPSMKYVQVAVPLIVLVLLLLFLSESRDKRRQLLFGALCALGAVPPPVSWTPG
jgi:hypothetical protein